ncbi:MAG TPA: hypothetical protein VFW87_19495, partial [Pirellulales bacterium]|nr:hypothetical protein [Pirellulales bacterium]
MRRKVPLLTWAIVLALPSAGALLPPLMPSALAQEDALEELYGNGVHLYNSGDFRAAYYELTRAVNNGSHDPRVLYYRGLCYLKLGRDQEGRSDFAKAASIEMSDSDRFYPVSKSLERVQGRARQLIERYRSSARLRAYQARERARYERYERIRRNEPNVLLSPPPGESSKLPAPPAGKAAQPEADEPPAPADDSDEMPAKPESDDAFAPEPAEAEAEMPADDDAFGAEKSDEEMPAEEPEPEMPAEDDAFGAKKSDEEMSDEEMPAEESEAEAPADDAFESEKSDEEMPPRTMPSGPRSPTKKCRLKTMPSGPRNPTKKCRLRNLLPTKPTPRCPPMSPRQPTVNPPKAKRRPKL